MRDLVPERLHRLNTESLRLGMTITHPHPPFLFLRVRPFACSHTTLLIDPIHTFERQPVVHARRMGLPSTTFSSAPFLQSSAKSEKSLGGQAVASLSVYKPCLLYTSPSPRDS